MNMKYKTKNKSNSNRKTNKEINYNVIIIINLFKQSCNIQLCIPKPVIVVAVLTQILHLRVDHGSKHDLVLNILSIMRCEKYYV